MKRVCGLLAAVFSALLLGGCGGSAAPASPVGNPAYYPAPAERTIESSQDFGSNSFPHILVVVKGPGSLGKPLEDGRSITLLASATSSKGAPLSLADANIAWSIPTHGSIDPAQNGQSAVYTAPLMGAGHEVETVSVRFAGQSQTYSASVTIDYERI